MLINNMAANTQNYYAATKTDMKIEEKEIESESRKESELEKVQKSLILSISAMNKQKNLKKCSLIQIHQL